MEAQECNGINGISCPKCGATCSILWWKDRALRHSDEYKDPVSILKCPEHGYLAHSVLESKNGVINDLKREIGVEI